VSDETPNLPPQTPRAPDGLELACTGIMRTEFGRRESHAVAKAMLRLTAEAAAAGRTVPAQPAGWRDRIPAGLAALLRPWPALALGTGLVLLVFTAGMAAFFLKPAWLVGSHSSALGAGVICTLTDESDARWAPNSPRLKVGSVVPTAPLQLESGVVELTFAWGAKVAVEGPAQFRVSNAMEMELQKGKLSTEVPKQSRGFTVKTPTATAVDLGTRFGAIVNSAGASEVDVFQGRVKLSATTAGNSRAEWKLTQGQAAMVDEHGAEAASALPEIAFPQPNLTVEVRPQNCGFDVAGRAAVGGVPADFGYWSGLAYSLISGARNGISPHSGRGMLQFLSAPAGNPSEVWQIMDLRAYKQLIDGGTVEATLSAYFNQVPNGGRQSGDKFGLALAAFDGLPDRVKSLWAERNTTALALADKEISADDLSSGWHKEAVTAKLPARTDFVIIELSATAGGRNAGCFADVVDLELSTPMRASSIAVGR
jgi:FecR protein